MEMSHTSSSNLESIRELLYQNCHCFEPKHKTTNIRKYVF